MITVRRPLLLLLPRPRVVAVMAAVVAAAVVIAPSHTQLPLPARPFATACWATRRLVVVDPPPQAWVRPQPA